MNFSNVLSVTIAASYVYLDCSYTPAAVQVLYTCTQLATLFLVLLKLMYLLLKQKVTTEFISYFPT